MLQTFDDDIWIADGPIAVVAGFRYPTRMVLIRLSDGTLFVWSPISLSDALRAAVDAFGQVRHIVAPNVHHHLFVGEWQAAYPDARLHAPPGLRKRRKDIVFDDDLRDDPAPGWLGQIDQVIVRGNPIIAEVVFFHRKSRTVIFADLMQHFERGWFMGWRRMIAGMDLMTTAEPTVPRKFRVSFLNRDIARASLRRILAWTPEKIVMAHASPIGSGGHTLIARAFAWLLG